MVSVLPVRGCCLTTTANTNINNTTFTAIQFGTLASNYDPCMWHSTSTNNTRITPNVLGRFLILGGARVNDSVGGSTFGIVIYKNGVDAGGEVFAKPDASGRRTSTIVASYTTTAITDYFELVVYQDSGSTRGITCGVFCVIWLG